MPKTQSDWHWEDIKAELAKRGLTLDEVALKAGRRRKTLSRVKSIYWPDAQALIAKALGKSPQEIWPSRYLPDGAPKPMGIGPKDSTRRSLANVHSRGAM